MSRPRPFARKGPNAESSFSRIYHKAEKVNQLGQASALCYPIPKPIPDSERWTVAGKVTCLKCLKIMEAQKELDREIRGKQTREEAE